MMLHRSPLVDLRLRLTLCSVLCGLLALQGVDAGLLQAGRRCGDVPGATCREGLACVPETPGSAVGICRDFNRSCESERCPRVWCGPNLLYVPEGKCCPECPPFPTLHTPTIASPVCTEEGVLHQEGESWQRDACITCTCRAGLPLCSSIQCSIPDNCQQLVTTPGQCCPTCAAVAPPPTVVTQCVEDGETHQDGESWTRNNNPCTTCFCVDGEILCAAQSCFVECRNPVFLPDTCCPICQDGVSETTTLPVPIATSLPPPPSPPLVIISPPTHCEDGAQIYENGATWNPNGDPCTSCQCEDGFPLCVAKSCYAGCEVKDQVFLPGVCCPLCPGDEGYPSIGAASTSQPTPTVTQTAPRPSTTATHITLSPTPPSTDETTSTPIIITATSTSEQPPAATTSTTCKDSGGVEQFDGASWCPTPHVKATCLSGIVSYTENSCPALACQEPKWTAGSCDCPVCPDGADEVIVVSAVLDMEYSQYLGEQDSVQEQLRTALSALGLKVTDIQAASYGLKQTQVIISLTPMSDDNTLLEEESLEALLQQLITPPVASLKVGHHEEPKSITGVSNPQVQSSSSNGSGGPNKTAVIVVVLTLTVAIALACAIVILVIVTRVRKMRAIPKTTTV